MKSQPKLLVVTTVSVMIEWFLLPFVAHFRAKGWTVDAAARGATSSPDCAAAFDRCHEMEWTRNPFDFPGMYRSIGRIREIVAQGGYDIVHVHTPIAAFLTRLALRRMRAEGAVKVVYTAHGFHFFKGNKALSNFIFSRLEKKAARWTDHLIVINREDYQAALTMLPADRVTFTQGGIGMDLEKYHLQDIPACTIDAIRGELRLGTDDVLYLTVAEFIPRKRHTDVIDALALAGDPDIHVAFAGTGRIFESVRSYAERKGVARQTHFLGFRKDIPALIAASQATILPSQQEGLPRAVMESMARGVPVIGADTRGTRDLLAGGCGTLVPVGEVNKLAEAMTAHKHGDSVAIRTMREKALEKVKLYDLKKILAAHDDLYERLLTGGNN